MIKYVKGDAVLPIGDDVKIVVHIVNDLGIFGAGFAKCVANTYPLVRDKYIEWARTGSNFGLRVSQLVQVNDYLYFVNLVGQRGVRGINDKTSPAPIRYFAVKKGLRDVWLWAKDMEASVHMPRIGCGLGGATWSMVEPIIKEELIDNGISVIVYDL